MSGKYSMHPLEAMAQGVTVKPELSGDACEIEKNPILLGRVVSTWRTAMSSAKYVKGGNRRDHVLFCAGMLHMLSIQQAEQGSKSWPEIGLLCDMLHEVISNHEQKGV